MRLACSPGMSKLGLKPIDCPIENRAVLTVPVLGLPSHLKGAIHMHPSIGRPSAKLGLDLQLACVKLRPNASL